jgi:hypothetical protein
VSKPLWLSLAAGLCIPVAYAQPSRTPDGVSVGTQHLLYANWIKTTAEVSGRLQPTELKSLDAAIEHIYQSNPSLARIRSGGTRHHLAPPQLRLGRNVGEWTGASFVPSMHASLGLAGTEYANARTREQLLNAQRDALVALYADALGQIRRKQAVYQQVTGALSSRDDDAKKKALEILHREVPHLTNLARLDQLNPKFKSASAAYMIEVLALASKTPKELSERGRKAAEQTVHRAADAVAKFNSTVTERITQVKQGLEATKNASGALQSVTEQIAKDPLAVANLLLLQRLGPNQQLDALAKGLHVGGNTANRDAVLKGLQDQFAVPTARNVQRASDAINHGVQVAETAVQIATALNIKIPREVNQAIEVGNIAMSLTSAFAGASPVGGTFALLSGIGGGSMFGGLSPSADPTTLHMLQEIQETLNEVVSLQRQTLERLDALDAKITAQHKEVMRLLMAIAGRVDWLIDQSLAREEVKIGTCDDFELQVRAAARTARSEGKPLYDAYAVLHNKSGDYQRNFVTCREQLQELTKLSNERPHYLLRNRDKLEQDSFSANPRSSTHTSVYDPAWRMTLDLLAMRDDPGCQATLMTRLTALPTRVTPTRSNSCDPGSAERTWTTPSGVSVSTYRAMNDYVSHDLQWSGDGTTLMATLLRYQIALAPFYEMTTGADSAEFKTQNALVAPWYNTSEAQDRFLRFMDVTSIAAAQETILGGALISEQVMDRLLDLASKPGFGVNALPTDDTFLKTCQTAADLATPGSVSNERFLCALERNPFMVVNALAGWFVVNGPVDYLNTYNRYYRHDVLNSMNLLIPKMHARLDAEGVYGFVLVRDDTKFIPPGGKKPAGWYFKTRGVLRPLIYTPLPSAYDIEHKSLKYRPQAEDLRAIVAQALEQYERFSIRANDTASQKLVHNIAASEAILVNVSQLPHQ